MIAIVSNVVQQVGHSQPLLKIHSIHLPCSSTDSRELITPCRRQISSMIALTFLSTWLLNWGSLSLSSATFSFLTMLRVFVMTERCVAIAAWISLWRLSASVLNSFLKLIWSDSKTASSLNLSLMILFRLLSLFRPVSLLVCHWATKNSSAFS